MQSFCQKLVSHVWFDRVIITLIIINGVILGLETVPQWVESYGNYLVWGNRLILLSFITEMFAKIIAVAPQFKRYFGNGWNCNY